MLDQLTQLVQQFGEQAIVKNQQVPDELNDAVKKEAGNGILEALSGIANSGQANILTDFLKGNGTQKDHPLLNIVQQQVGAKLGSQFSMDNQTVEGITKDLIPNVLGQLVGNAKNPNVKGFELQDLVGMITKGDSKTQGSILSQLGTSLLDQNGDGKLDLNDAMSALSDSGKEKSKSGGLGALLGKFFGK